MNSTFCTPQKKKLPTATSSGTFRFLDQQPHNTAFGSGSSSSSACSLKTPGSVKRTGRFHLLPIMNRTPISRLSSTNRSGVVINPFEASLTERLHLPMICSPSLFHRPATPQLSSTQFEWTIDEVASLGPMHVEADETQFIMQTDPDMEARAQEAITSYFRDNHILPSPISCPLRDAASKIKLLPDDHDDVVEDLTVDRGHSTSVKKQKTTTREGTSQTVLTFPPRLPKAMEDMIAGFCTYTQDQQQEPEYSALNDSSNASLRRKLFETSLASSADLSHHEADHHHAALLLEEVVPIRTPELNLEVKVRTRHFGSPTDNHLEVSSETKREGFGSLSPILSSTGSTPAQNSLYRSSTPERMTQYSMSFNSVEMRSEHGSAMKTMEAEKDGKSSDKQSDDSVEEDMSLLSDMNVTASQPPTTRTEDSQRTPIRRNNRSASRKNLSRSFSQILSEELVEAYETRRIEELPSCLPEEVITDDDDEMDASEGILRGRKGDPKRLLIRSLSSGASESLCQTDSGFNDGDLANTCCGGSDKLLMASSTPAIKGSHHRTTTEDVSMRYFVL